MERAVDRELGFFDIITDKQTYLSMIYLMLSFPLGMFYFIFITAVFLVGLSLVPVFIGIPILYVLMISVKCFMKFERKIAMVFLGTSIGEVTEAAVKSSGILRRFKDELLDKELWKGLTYLAMKFLLGIIVFCLCISLAALSLGLITAPAVYYYVDYNMQFASGLHLNIDDVEVNGLLGLFGIIASPQQEMLVFMILGVFVSLGSMHLLNRTAYLMGGLLKLMSPRTQKIVVEMN